MDRLLSFMGDGVSAITASLRADFGDWRNAPNHQHCALSTLGRGFEFYVEQGFDRSLTDIEQQAFAEGVDAVEICENDLEDWTPPY